MTIMRTFPALLLAMLALLAAVATAGAAPKATVSAVTNLSALPAGQNGVVAVVVEIPPGLHAQSHDPKMDGAIPFVVKPDPSPDVEFLPPVYPPGADVQYPALGPANVYAGRVVVYLPLRVKPDAPAGPITLAGKVTYQACDDRVCYPPQHPAFSVATQVVPATRAVTQQNAETFAAFDPHVFAAGATTTPAPPPPPPPSSSSSSTPIDFLGHTFRLAAGGYGLAFAVALAVGVLFNLMPCVLPVVPLKAIGFYEVSRHNRAKCFALGLVFSAGVVAVFVGLAALLLLVPHTLTWGEQFKYGWFVWALVALLVVMALGMFGLFEVILPSAVYSLAPTHETVGGNFLFGAFTAILSTPCTAPMFAGLLAWAIAQPKPIGVAVVITVGVGMALPYLILSAFPGLASRVPRTGPWSAVLKQTMGFLLLAVAVYFAGGRLAHDRSFFWAVFAVVAAGSLFLVVRTAQLSRRAAPVAFAVVTSVALCAVALVVTLRLTHPPVSGGLQWEPYSEQAFARASTGGKPVIVEFTAGWCLNCLTLEATTFHDARLAQALHDRGVVLFRADLTDESAPGWPMLKTLNQSGGIPLTAIFAPGKNDPLKLTSVYTPQNLIDALDRAKG